MVSVDDNLEMGAYLIRDAALLWRAMDDVIRGDVKTKNEYQLTDGLQRMIERGAVFTTVTVADWPTAILPVLAS